MQRITVVCMGKLGEPFYAAGVAEYTKRLGRFCRLHWVELTEEPLDEARAGPALVADALAKEGGRILAALPKGARVVALCVEGKEMDSEAFAGWLEQAALSGAGDVAFVIGSSHGLAEAVKRRAELLLSLSGMTLPHQLARLVLAEQIYRAFMIRSGGRYHK